MTVLARKTSMARNGALVALLALVAAGCSTSRFDTIDSRPAPLTPAPSGQVTSNQLPPPTATGPTDPSAFPPAPGTQPGTDVAAATPGIQTPPPNAPAVTKEAMVGAWKVSAGGSGCQMMLSLTKMSSDFRAASLRCPGDAASVAAWNVAGSQVVLKDNGGNTVARLYASGPTRYDGQTSGGQPISFSR
ncbi:MAG: AprI/Inh family metalloprotease inhibitor [Mesorhizobium sp.]